MNAVDLKLNCENHDVNKENMIMMMSKRSVALYLFVVLYGYSSWYDHGGPPYYCYYWRRKQGWKPVALTRTTSCEELRGTAAVYLPCSNCTILRFGSVDRRWM